MSSILRSATVFLVVLGLLLCALAFGRAYGTGEEIRNNGREVLFELRPVDPRSLLLGDYMTLRYDLGLRPIWPRDPGEEDLPKPSDLPEDLRAGIAEFKLDENNVARIVNLQAPPKYPEGALRIRYKRPHTNRVTIGGERYYLQSGTAERFENAKYGIFRVMPDGRALLSGLADEKRRPILIAGEAPNSVAFDD